MVSRKLLAFFFLLSGIMPDSELSCLVFPPFGLSEMYWPLFHHCLPRTHSLSQQKSIAIGTKDAFFMVA